MKYVRWKIKPKPTYNLGDTRIKEKFLLFPKCIGEEARWLERSKILQVRKDRYVYDYSTVVQEFYWEDIKFID